MPPSQPRSFVIEMVTPLPPGQALDVACGEGRHVAWLSQQGWQVVGLDDDPEALSIASTKAPAARLELRDVEADLLPEAMTESYQLVVTTFFLHRPLIPDLFRVLQPGGFWLLETFHIENRRRHGHPRTRAFCLESGEAEQLAKGAGFDVEAIREGEHSGRWTSQLLARRPGG